MKFGRKRDGKGANGGQKKKRETKRRNKTEKESCYQRKLHISPTKKKYTDQNKETQGRGAQMVGLNRMSGVKLGVGLGRSDKESSGGKKNRNLKKRKMNGLNYQIKGCILEIHASTLHQRKQPRKEGATGA